MIKFNKIIRPAIFLVVLLILGGGYVFSKNGDFTKLTPIVQNNNTSQSANVRPETPQYTVIVLSRPTIIHEAVPVVLSGSSIEPIPSGKISIPIEIKNISANPFITSFYFSDCKFLDKKGNIYPIGPFLMFDNTKFNEAVLLGAIIKTNIISKPFNLSTQKCTYDSTGKNICQKVEFSHIESCNTAISTNDNRADQSNQYPIKVNFPE